MDKWCVLPARIICLFGNQVIKCAYRQIYWPIFFILISTVASKGYPADGCRGATLFNEALFHIHLMLTKKEDWSVSWCTCVSPADALWSGMVGSCNIPFGHVWEFHNDCLRCTGLIVLNGFYGIMCEFSIIISLASSSGIIRFDSRHFKITFVIYSLSSLGIPKTASCTS